MEHGAIFSIRLKTTFRPYSGLGSRSSIRQMSKDVSRISLVCLFSIFQVRNDPVWSTPHLVTQHIDRCQRKCESGELWDSPEKKKGIVIFLNLY
jgi:hypothetical protein